MQSALLIPWSSFPSFLNFIFWVTFSISNRYEGAFNFPFHIGKNSLSIIQHGEKFDLRVNNQSFEHMYNQRKYQFLNDKSYVKMLEDRK